MNENFRQKVIQVGEKGVEILEKYFEGASQEGEKVRQASRMIAHAIKIEHMNQLKDHGDKSLALRLIQYLPKNEELRRRYIEMTNPEIKPLLLDRPKK